MGFGDLKNKTGLKALDDYLADKSYIEGFQPSQADAVVFKGLSGAPAAEFVNALRWYNQINSYGGAKDSFPGVAKALTQYGPAGGDAQAAKKDDDDFDLFGESDSEEEEDEETKAKLAAYAAKKSKKPALIAKSSILLDVKPWDDETDMKALEEKVRSVQTEGLVWGAAKLVPVGYGIKKLQINCVVEDDKVGTDFLEEEICAFEDFVQSVDVAAFNKI
ncbi:elongation factor 1-beta-like [Mya arenaria]|uniref:elongation factor 1-beta-like n=1 Tax=Mya arenaria TaxID=6604 RepID=UPI0022E9537A|nr:elongation factor 1-beta-like [Mya arenaria]